MVLLKSILLKAKLFKQSSKFPMDKIKLCPTFFPLLNILFETEGFIAEEKCIAAVVDF